VTAILCGHDGRRGFIWHLAVHPRFRRQGIGRRLVDRCLCGLRQAGIEKCVAIAFDSNRDGIAFWEQIGWMLRKDVSLIAKDIANVNFRAVRKVFCQDLAGRSEILDEHGKNVVNWIISGIIYAIVSGLLIPICGVGIVPLIALGVVAIVFPIIGGVKANNGEVWKYPLTISFL
jgi:uncharacterized membrane protein